MILVAAMVLQPLAALVVDTAAPLLGLVLAFSVAMLQRVERQAGALVGKIGALPAKDDMMRQLVDSSFDAIITFADGGTVLSYNRAAERIFGAPAKAIIGGLVAALLPDDRGLSLEALAQAESSHELRGAHAEGRYFPVEATFSRIRVDEKRLGIAILRDITERKAQQAELERLALHDALTALPNRTLLNDRIEMAINAAKRAGMSMAVLLLDLDRFKDVNDTLGHHFGDLLLTEVGPRLQRPPRAVDTVSAAGRRRVRGAPAGPDRSRDRVQGGRAPGGLADPAVWHQRPGPRGRRQHRRGALSRPRPDRSASPAARRRRDVRGQARPDRLRSSTPRRPTPTASASYPERTVAARDREWADGARVPAEDRRPTAGVAGVEALIRWHHPDWGPYRPASSSTARSRPA